MGLGGLPIAAGLLALRSLQRDPVSRPPTFAQEGSWPWRTFFPGPSYSQRPWGSGLELPGSSSNGLAEPSGALRSAGSRAGASCAVRFTGRRSPSVLAAGSLPACRLGRSLQSASPGCCLAHQSLASRRLLNFIGSISGPVTTKSPLIMRIVSVVIGAPYPKSSSAPASPRRRLRASEGSAQRFAALRV